MSSDISMDRLWEWWRKLATRELSLERQYKPLLAEHEVVHRERQALENLMAARGGAPKIEQQIVVEWERLRKGEELPSLERKPMDVAYDILVRAGKPMHYSAILSELTKSGIVIGGRDPRNTVLAYLGRDRRFAKAPEVKRGYWKLKEWKNESRMGGDATA